MDALAAMVETGRRVAASEAEAEAAMIVAAMTVGDMTVVVTTVAAEVDLLVWGKLHSATASRPRYLYAFCIRLVSCCLTHYLSTTKQCM